MEKVLVEINVPAAGVSYDLRLPRHLLVAEVIPLLCRLVEELSDGLFVSDKHVVLCIRRTGEPLDINRTIGELSLVNGSELMLV